jgi:plasmid maintenance system antidote protein VapI
MKNKIISEKTGLSPAEVTRILNLTRYRRRVSWRQAVHLSQAFGRTITFWRGANEADVKRALSEIE